MKMEDWRRDYKEVRPHSAIGKHDADFVVELLIGTPADMSASLNDAKMCNLVH